MAFSPDGTQLAVLTRDHVVSLRGETVPRGPARRERPGVHARRPPADLHRPRGLWDAAADRLERRVVVRDLATHTGTTLTGHTGPVRAVAFTRDDVVVSGDGRIIRWSLSAQDAEERIRARTYPRSEVCGTTRPDS
ncbi:hypothetical protein [Lentzea sp. NPDC060358]|uniref:hypothetical protein n=1 Tax=Lentzea sp. NPDC060358 TaxID=3347103 RepID=UPI00365AA26F